MQAVIMAGGEGTRLRPLTRHIPKPLLPVLDKPMMEHIIRHLRHFGIKDIIVTLFYQARRIVDYFGDGSDWGVRIHYAVEDEPLGTAGSVKNAARFINQPFVIISGDAVLDLDLRSLTKFHRRKRADVTITLKKVSDPVEYGIVLLEEDNSITRFLEKPGWGEVFSDAVNTGIYLLQPEVLKMIPAGESYDFSKELFPAMMKKNKRLFGYVAKGYWTDVGDLDEYRSAHRDILDGKVDMRIPGATIQKKVWVGEGVEIDETAHIESPSFIGSYCRINEGARLGKHTVLGDGVVIDRGAQVQRSVIMRNSYIGEHAVVRDAIIADRAVIEENCIIDEGAVVGARCSLGRAVEVSAGVKIWPDKEVEEGALVTENMVWQSYGRKSFFRSGKVLGLVNIRITPEFCARLGAAIGAYFGREATAVISRDATAASRLVKRALSSGLLSQGINLCDLEISPAPLAPYAINIHGAVGGVHIHVSDLHPQVIEIECRSPGGDYIDRGAERKVEMAYYREDYPLVKMADVGEVSYAARVADIYRDELVQVVNTDGIRARMPHIVVECGKDNASEVVPEILSALGCRIITLANDGRTPDSKQEYEKIRTLTRYNADAGVRVHPNVDGFILFDERGREISPPAITLLLAEAVWSRFPGAHITVSVIAPSGIETLAARHKGRVTRCAVEGNPVMSVRLPRKTRLPGIANRVSKYFFRRMDAIFSLSLIVEQMARSGEKLSSMGRELPRSNRKCVEIMCPWEKKAGVIRLFAEAHQHQSPVLIDGVKLEDEEGWVLALPDGGRPLIRVYAEGKTTDLRNRKLRVCTREIKKIIHSKGGE